MKNLKRCMLIMLLTFTYAAVFAQPAADRKKMYASLPSSVRVDKNTFIRTFGFSTGSDISLVLSPELSFSGKVISNEKKYGGLQTIIIRSADNMLLQITAVKDKDENISYAGRIFGANAADGYEIKNNNGEYSMQKYEVDNIFQPCNHG